MEPSLGRRDPRLHLPDHRGGVGSTCGARRSDRRHERAPPRHRAHPLRRAVPSEAERLEPAISRSRLAVRPFAVEPAGCSPRARPRAGSPGRLAWVRAGGAPGSRSAVLQHRLEPRTPPSVPVPWAPLVRARANSPEAFVIVQRMLFRRASTMIRLSPSGLLLTDDDVLGTRGSQASQASSGRN
jgi:hypothetical protein